MPRNSQSRVAPGSGKDYNGFMLHVVNGDATLALLKQSPVAGTFLVWKDMLMEGPVSANGGALDLKARAAFLHAKYGADPKKYLSGMKALFAALDKAARGKDEVVLWFEEDFFCQIHLVYLLAHLPAGLRRQGRVSVICPDKPLGARLPAAFPKLLANRLPLKPALAALAARVWKAYAADSTAGWQAFLAWAQSGDGFAAWPALRQGLRAHLGRLPTAHGGPNALEAALLRPLASGPLDFAHYARRVWSEPMAKPLGLGDMQIARYALDLSEAPQPPLTLSGTRPRPGQAPDPEDWKLHLTDAGRARLEEAAIVFGAEPASRNGDATLTEGPRLPKRKAAGKAGVGKAGAGKTATGKAATRKTGKGKAGTNTGAGKARTGKVRAVRTSFARP